MWVVSTRFPSHIQAQKTQNAQKAYTHTHTHTEHIKREVLFKQNGLKRRVFGDEGERSAESAEKKRNQEKESVDDIRRDYYPGGGGGEREGRPWPRRNNRARIKTATKVGTRKAH